MPIVRGFAVDDLNRWSWRPGRARAAAAATSTSTAPAARTTPTSARSRPAAALNPGRQLFEEMVYVLEGNGSTQVWYDEGKKVSFEWKAGSLFAIPLNAWHRHFNGRGDRPARFLAVTNAPVVMNLFHNLNSSSSTPFAFDDRFAGQHDFFDGEGKMSARATTSCWRRTSCPTALGIELYTWKERGAGGQERACSSWRQHDGRAHLRVPGRHLQEGPPPRPGRPRHHPRRPAGTRCSGRRARSRERVDWRPGSMVVPPEHWFHQHFNSGADARALPGAALGQPPLRPRRGDPGRRGARDVDVKQGGAQIEYPDEDHAIHELFEARGAAQRRDLPHALDDSLVHGGVKPSSDRAPGEGVHGAGHHHAHDFSHLADLVDHHGDDAELTEEDLAALEEVIWKVDHVELKTVGVDVGSSTSHLMFARVLLQRLVDVLSSRFVVVEREILWRSPILLTPYLPDDRIDAARLGAFVHEAYHAAGLDRRRSTRAP